MPVVPSDLLSKTAGGDTAVIPVRLCALPPFHSAVMQLLSANTAQDLEPERIVDLVKGDPALAAEVLFLANSSLFGFPSRIQGLRHAVALLGVERVKTLALTVAMRLLLGKGGPTVDYCWTHSAACAVIAAEISPLFDESEDAAYTAALLHDVGRLGLLKSYPKEYGRLLSKEYAEPEDVGQAERDTFQVDHGVAGAWLVGYWSFPTSFAEICEHHHSVITQGDSALLCVVKASCAIADALGYSAVKFAHPASNRLAVRRTVPASVLAKLPAGVTREAVAARLNTLR